MSPSPTPWLRDHRGGRKECLWQYILTNYFPKIFLETYILAGGFPNGSVTKNPPAVQEMQERQVWSLGQQDPLEEEMATHSSILAWKIPWLEEPGGLLSMGLQKIGHDWAPELAWAHACVHACSYTHTHILAEVYRNFCFSTSTPSCLILFQDCNHLLEELGTVSNYSIFCKNLYDVELNIPCSICTTCIWNYLEMMFFSISSFFF